MTLPIYRRTSSHFVTLYRVQPDGTLTELGCYFGPSAHALADHQQQQDVLEIAAANAWFGLKPDGTSHKDHEHNNNNNQTQP